MSLPLHKRYEIVFLHEHPNQTQVKIAKSWKVENGIKELPWLSMSPDQNPIENI